MRGRNRNEEFNPREEIVILNNWSCLGCLVGGGDGAVIL